MSATHDRRALEAEIADAVRTGLGAGVRVEGFAWLDAHLSLRAYARVHTDSTRVPTLVARVEAHEDPAGRPPGIPPEPPLGPIRALLERAGLPVPEHYGGTAKIDLLEDVGTTSLQKTLLRCDDRERHDLYCEACELVPRIQRVEPAPGVAAFERHLDSAHFLYKADLFVHHALPECGRPATPAEIAEVRDAFSCIAEVSRRAPQRLAHRDFQSANLHLREGRPAGRRLTMIDLQGAFLAPPEYDLVSLLHDSYVELPEAEIANLLERVRTDLPDAPEPGEFQRRFDLLTLTRKGKDLARFLYAANERGDTRFLAYVGTTVRQLRTAVSRAAGLEPRLAGLADRIHELPESACER